MVAKVTTKKKCGKLFSGKKIDKVNLLLDARVQIMLVKHFQN